MNSELVVKTNCRPRISHNRYHNVIVNSFFPHQSNYAITVQKHYRHYSKIFFEKLNEKKIEYPFPFGITMETIFLPLWPTTIDIIICFFPCPLHFYFDTLIRLILIVSSVRLLFIFTSVVIDWNFWNRHEIDARCPSNSLHNLPQ